MSEEKWEPERSLKSNAKNFILCVSYIIPYPQAQTSKQTKLQFSSFLIIQSLNLLLTNVRAVHKYFCCWQSIIFPILCQNRIELTLELMNHGNNRSICKLLGFDRIMRWSAYVIPSHAVKYRTNSRVATIIGGLPFFRQFRNSEFRPQNKHLLFVTVSSFNTWSPSF